jgi:hypothetical protein
LNVIVASPDATSTCNRRRLPAIASMRAGSFSVSAGRPV